MKEEIMREVGELVKLGKLDIYIFIFISSHSFISKI